MIAYPPHWAFWTFDCQATACRRTNLSHDSDIRFVISHLTIAVHAYMIPNGEFCKKDPRGGLRSNDIFRKILSKHLHIFLPLVSTLKYFSPWHFLKIIILPVLIFLFVLLTGKSRYLPVYQYSHELERDRARSIPRSNDEPKCPRTSHRKTLLSFGWVIVVGTPPPPTKK